MEEVNWNSHVLELEEFMATDAVSEQLSQVLQFQINLGNENEEQRERVWDSIKSLIRGMPGSPVRRGIKPSLPAAVRVVVDSVVNTVETSASDFFNSDAAIQAVVLQHGKAGGGAYASASDYASYLGKKARSNMTKMFKEGSWDGSLDGLLGTIDADLSEEE
tara:strand:+ start:22 stop:507 length:486 start_codon:yes stop_codon:yes gene_type:complete